MKILEKHSHKKVIECFNNLGKGNLKVAAFVIHSTSIMALFEIHQKCKSHFLNELRVSFKNFAISTGNKCVGIYV